MQKNILKPYHTLVDVAMSSDIISTPTNIQWLDNVGVQLMFTGTPTGNFFIDLSLDYNPPGNSQPFNAGTWTAIAFTGQPAASGVDGDIYLDLNQMSSPYLRVRYVRASGTGVLNGYVTSKEV